MNGNYRMEKSGTSNGEKNKEQTQALISAKKNNKATMPEGKKETQEKNT